jgi:hypothetical protein
VTHFTHGSKADRFFGAIARKSNGSISEHDRQRRGPLGEVNGLTEPSWKFAQAYVCDSGVARPTGVPVLALRRDVELVPYQRRIRHRVAIKLD